MFKVVLGKQDLKGVIADRDKKQGDIFFCFHREANQFMWGSKELATEQMKEWRRMKKEGEIHMNPKNNRTRIIGGKEWHILVVQYGSSPEAIQSIGIDSLGMGFDDGQFFVDGLIYCFKSQVNRNRIFEYVMKP